MMGRILSAALLGLALGASPLAAQQPSSESAPGPTPAQLDEVARLIEKHYVRSIAPESLSFAARACFEHTLDPYSRYFDPTAFAQFSSELEGRIGGIGVHLQMDTTSHVLRISSPLLDSPSLSAGVRRGDVVVAIDGRPVRGRSFDDDVASLRGRVNTRVSITVRHPGATSDTTLTMRRAVVETPSVRGIRVTGPDAHRFLVDPTAGIAYLRVDQMSRNAVPECAEALRRIRAMGAQALVLDLRDDPGGLVTAAVGIADLFLDSGVVVTQRVRGERDHVFRAKRGAACSLPIALLVDASTASSSEMLTSCLQDQHRATVIGVRTFGKGVGQQVYRLRDGGAVKLTNFSYWRPSGRPIERHMPGFDSEHGGVWPDSGFDLAVPESVFGAWAFDAYNRSIAANEADALPDSAALPSDPQLARAIELLREKRAR